MMRSLKTAEIRFNFASKRFKIEDFWLRNSFRFSF